ncbi:MAG: sulfite exporter TauE/SafE family protein, partial [Pseudomonadota bacterium]
GFVNRVFALPGKLAEMEFISMSPGTAAILDKIGIWAFFIVIGLFGVWVIGTFIMNTKTLRGVEA